jgi:hypothetical protein
MIFLIPWLLQVLPMPQPGPPAMVEDLIATGHWSPTLRPDSRGYLGTSSGPVLQLGYAKLSVESQRTELGGLRSGHDSIEASTLFGAGYSTVPTSGSVTRTDLKAEYGLGDATSLRLTIPFESRTLRFEDGLGATTRETVHGLADVQIGAGMELSHQDRRRTELEVLVSVPTGKTNARAGRAGVPGRPLLPYSMQLGAGTYALQPGITWTYWSSQWSFGTAAQATLPIDKNDQGWSRGDELRLSSWVSRRIDPFRSVVAGLDYLQEDSIQGQDPNMDPLLDPSFDPSFTGGKSLYLDLGLHMIVETNNRLALEIGVPVWRETEGPQVETDFRFAVAWWLSF